MHGPAFDSLSPCLSRHLFRPHRRSHYCFHQLSGCLDGYGTYGEGDYNYIRANSYINNEQGMIHFPTSRELRLLYSLTLCGLTRMVPTIDYMIDEARTWSCNDSECAKHLATLVIVTNSPASIAKPTYRLPPFDLHNVETPAPIHHHQNASTATLYILETDTT
jgi:hypothetical protein